MPLTPYTGLFAPGCVYSAFLLVDFGLRYVVEKQGACIAANVRLFGDLLCHRSRKCSASPDKIGVVYWDFPLYEQSSIRVLIGLHISGLRTVSIRGSIPTVNPKTLNPHSICWRAANCTTWFPAGHCVCGGGGGGEEHQA